MSSITRSVKSRKITSFCYHAEDAKAVFLAGSFNGWNSQSTPMTKRIPANGQQTLSSLSERMSIDMWPMANGATSPRAQTTKLVQVAAPTRSGPRTENFKSTDDLR